MSNNTISVYHKDDYFASITPIMPDEYPFWISAYGKSLHDPTAPHHEITQNTSVTRIQCVLSGKEIINSKNISCIATAGDTYILHEGDTHNYYSDTSHPCHKVWFHVKGKLAREIIKIYNLNDVILLKNIDTSEWILKMHELCQSIKDPYVIQEEGAALFVKFINHISREYKTKQQNIDFLDDIKSYIDLHILDALPIEMLAAISKTSVDHTIRNFKNKFGLTPHQYILQSKMNLAKTFLRSTNESIEDIAEKLSFCNVGYFSNAFYKRVGLRPSEYRKEIREESEIKFGFKAINPK